MKESTTLTVLPTDLIFEICKFIDWTDVIFFISRVCKTWRDEVCLILIRNYLPASFHQTLTSFEELFQTRQGRSLLKYCLRRNVMSLAHTFYMNQKVNDSNTSVFSKPPFMKRELERLKLCFGQFSDIRNGVKSPIPKKPIEECKEEAPKGFFQQAVGYVASFFEKKETNTTTNNYTTVAVGTKFFPTNPNPLYDVMYKVVLDGRWGVGKRSFIHCLAERNSIDSASNTTTIGMEFNMITWCIGDEFKIRSQMWYQCGPERFKSITRAYYRAASFVLLMFDMTDRTTFEHLQSNFVESIKPSVEGLYDTEFIVIATKLDKADKRTVSTQEGEDFALNVVGGAPYIEITNTDWSYSHILTWYCSLLKYFIVVDKSSNNVNNDSK